MLRRREGVELCFLAVQVGLAVPLLHRAEDQDCGLPSPVPVKCSFVPKQKPLSADSCTGACALWVGTEDSCVLGDFCSPVPAFGKSSLSASSAALSLSLSSYTTVPFVAVTSAG